MKRFLQIAVLASLAAAAGCGGETGAQVGGGGGTTAGAPMNLVITATPSAAITPLSFQITVAAVTLNPGNVSALAAPIQVDLARLQTEESLLGTLNVAAGTYTTATLTFANPVITLQNNTGSTLTAGTSTCTNGQLCSNLSPTMTNASVTVNLPGGGTSLATNVAAALQVAIDPAVFLTNSSGTLGVNAQASGAVTLTVLTATSSTPFTAFEDVAGVVGTVNTAAGTFQLQTGLGTYTLGTTTGSSATTYLNFPASGTCAANFACLANGQIVWANFNLLQSGSLMATEVGFEDAASSQQEVEGVVVSTTATPPAQFRMMVVQKTPSSSGPATGAVVTVASAMTETFDIDNLGTGSATNAFSFRGVQDLVLGQEVQLQAATGSTNSQIVASRVRLRSSRLTANISNIALPNIILGNGSLPTFFSNAGITQIQCVVLAPPALGAYTEVGGTANSIAQIAIGNTVSVRGQLFKNGSTFPLVTTKIVKQP